MSEFALYDQALAEFETIKISQSDLASEHDDCGDDNQCNHLDVVDENGVLSCLECGEQLRKTITHEKEWRFYGHSDTKRTSDPNRVQIRKTDERNINKDVENMGFSETIISKANEIYSQITKGQIFRGESRKAVIFACIYYSFMLSGKCQTPKKLIDAFGLDKKSSLKGLKIVKVCAAKDSPIHTLPLTAVHHIHEIMSKCNAEREQEKEVIEIYLKTKNRSSKLNRARPQSVAASIIYYWMCKKGLNVTMDITLKKFANTVDLSELTIGKNAKEIALILGTPDVL